MVLEESIKILLARTPLKAPQEEVGHNVEISLQERRSENFDV